MPTLSDRLGQVRERIAAAERAAGVAAGSVELVAVTKTSSADMIRKLYALGLRRFGESRVQELVPKAEELPGDIEWHMLGHLQENKINKMLSCTGLLQSLDSMTLATAIDKRAQRLQRILPALLEVNTSREPQKTGFAPEAVLEAYAAVAELRGLRPCGLMTMAPDSDDERRVRACFHELRQLFDTLANTGPAPTILSMGMSQDYEWAIFEGANLVRIGRALVGP